MKRKIYLIPIVLTFWGCTFAQAPVSGTVDGFEPASTNQPGKLFPQVNKSGQVRVSLNAPDAQKVQLDIGGKKYDLQKNEKGIWTGESLPQNQGFHMYQLWVDGVNTPDPGSSTFYDDGHCSSGIEIPADDQFFYALKDVPHGEIRQKVYYSKINRAWRRCFVYTHLVMIKISGRAIRCFICSMVVEATKRAGQIRVRPV